MKSRHYFLRFVYAGGLLAATSFGPRALATTTNVNITGSDTFSPSSVSISVNDTVQWTWTGGDHSTTSDTGLWDSGQKTTGTFTNKFTTSGSFGYHCTVHTFMLGTVTVAASTQPPSVFVSSPANGSIFAAPYAATLNATASDPNPGGSVTKVQFFTNSVSAGNVLSAPFNLAIGNLAAGSYQVKAVATDNLGATNTSTNITFTVVTPAPVTITNPALLSATQFKLTYSANPGLRYVVERSSNLSNFVGIITNTAAATSVTFTDSAAGPYQGYYRVGRLPNP